MIGDVIMTEPALRALAKTSGEPTGYRVPGLARSLFETHPDIRLMDEGTAVGKDAFWLDATESFMAGMQNCRHMTDEYFNQVGLDPDTFPDEERIPRFYGDPFDLPISPSGKIALCPISLNCNSRTHPGAKANKNAHMSWWDELVERLPYPAIQIGGPDDTVIPGIELCLGRPLREAAAVMRNAVAVISVETGPGHLAGAAGARVVMMNAASPTWLYMHRGAASISAVCSSVPPCWTVDDTLLALDYVLGETG